MYLYHIRKKSYSFRSLRQQFNIVVISVLNNFLFCTALSNFHNKKKGMKSKKERKANEIIIFYIFVKTKKKKGKRKLQMS